MNNPDLSERRLAIFNRLRDEYPYYAPRCLKIRDKSGSLVPFTFNRAQLYIHTKLEEQKKRTGKVRAVIVKARQQGCTTYITGRYFHRSTLFHGQNVFILAHIADSTHAIFKKVGAFYDNAPEPIKPRVKVSNQRNLAFEGVDSEYNIGTAGSADIGRGTTIQLFHGSECAFWPNTDELMGGVMQGVADVSGTEIIFESTANGMGNLFHHMAIGGLGSDSDFITIFTPWFWSDEYRAVPPADFCPTPEERSLMDLHGLDEQQIFWRRKKINDSFKGKVWDFMREYPCTLQEAFIASGETLFSAELVQKARTSKIKDPSAPLVLGVDPGRTGDNTALVWRRGREVVRKRIYTEMDEMKLAYIVAQELDKGAIVKCFIDVGLGYGTIDRLRELGYGRFVVPVHFGEQAIECDIYLNKRTEMYDLARKWLEDGGTSIPDDEEFVTALLCIPPLKVTTGRGVLSLPSKEEIKKIMGDKVQILNQIDALALTFAMPVYSAAVANRVKRAEPEMIRKHSPLSTIRKFAKGSSGSTTYTGSISFTK